MCCTKKVPRSGHWLGVFGQNDNDDDNFRMDKLKNVYQYFISHVKYSSFSFKYLYICVYTMYIVIDYHIGCCTVSREVVKLQHSSCEWP